MILFQTNVLDLTFSRDFFVYGEPEHKVGLVVILKQFYSQLNYFDLNDDRAD